MLVDNRLVKTTRKQRRATREEDRAPVLTFNVKSLRCGRFSGKSDDNNNNSAPEVHPKAAAGQSELVTRRAELGQ